MKRSSNLVPRPDGGPPLPAWIEVDEEIHWNPDLFADHSQRIGLHEAAHAVANHMLGRITMSAKVGDREGVVNSLPTDDTYARVVCALAGKAYERLLGLDPSDDTYDLEQAERALKAAGLSGAGLDRAARICEEAALAMAGSERFQALVHILAPILTKDRYVSGTRIQEILVKSDPMKGSRARSTVERHGHKPRRRQRYEVTARRSGKVLYSGHDEAEAYAILRKTPGALLVGWGD